jgi:hypothetical protein
MVTVFCVTLLTHISFTMTMKNSFILLIVVVLALGDNASSFTSLLSQKAKCRFATTGSGTALAGWFDAKPSDGGSGNTKKNTKNDDMFEAQQEMLRARRGELGKDEVKEKNAKKKAKQVSKTKILDKAAAKDAASMYADDGEQETKFKFPWQK